MIFDRTQKDVEDAVKIRNEKVKTNQVLTEEEIATLERGMLTVNSLNRIEGKQEELRNIFNSMGYWNTPIITKTWDPTEIFNIHDFQRIINNTNILRDAFFVYSSTPKTPKISYHFEDINSLERILFDLEEIEINTKKLYRECGSFNCGEG